MPSVRAGPEEAVPLPRRRRLDPAVTYAYPLLGAHVGTRDGRGAALRRPAAPGDAPGPGVRAGIAARPAVAATLAAPGDVVSGR
ncbi:hypothetical protein ACFWUW_30440 [Streptomyces sp. NPDC058655]|uniref:hypothetical protein n=1 Tax=Streptomyces sp. NPDC058655 TaxID=3346577 RepID=UPI0036694C5C